MQKDVRLRGLKRVALKQILLAMLIDRSRSGYSLHQMFFEPRPRSSQIYRALDEMVEEGLVSYDRVQQKKRPARKIFSITEAGKTELTNWIKERPAGGLVRDRIVQKVWFGNLFNNKDTIEALRAYISEREDELKYYKRRIKTLLTNKERDDSSLDDFYWNVALDYIKQRTEVDLKWAEKSIRQLSDL